MSDTSQSEPNIIRPDWIKQLIDESEREATETIGLKLLKSEVRCVVWNMAITLGFKKNGVPGRACRLLERYFYFLLRSYEKIPTEAVRSAILERVKNRLMLIIACCVHLSAKMDSADSYISPTVLRVALVCKGITCTVNDIVQTEAEVYKVLGYRIPLWTSVDIGEMLATEIGISSDMMKEVAVIVDMAEYLRNIVERKISKGYTNTPDAVSTLHLAASAVVVVARLEPIYSKQRATLATAIASATEPTSATRLDRLARLVSAPLLYLTCLADIILGVIKNEHQKKSTPIILKRKRTD